MKKRVLIGTGVVLLAALVFAVFSLLKPPVPVAFIRVVDEAGRPVEGASITPDGLRPKKSGSHYGWNDSFNRGVKVVSVQTDADGYAEVSYPFYVDEKLETGGITFAVDHADYCADRPERVVAASPPANAPLQDKLKHLALRLAHRVSARPDPVVLKRGGILRVTGFMGTRENMVTNLAAEVSRMWPAGTNYWRSSGPTLWTTKAVPGNTMLRAMYFPADGPACFSSMMSFVAGAGETNLIELKLERGVRITGKLDDSVPRPVRDGRVCTRVFEEGHDGDSIAPVWVAWSPIAEDGRFGFESLPPGRMEIIGTCDGFVSSNGPPWKGRVTGQRVPQQFPISGPAQEIILQMEAAAACEVTILDDAGKALPGARAGFSPNVLWGGNGSTIFCWDTYNSEDGFRTGTFPSWEEVSKLTRESFRKTSDERGVALVQNIPAGDQSCYVTHTNFAMPIRRTGGMADRHLSVDLLPGTTNRIRVNMQKPGTEALSH